MTTSSRILACLLLALTSLAAAQDVDSDGDGLSDFDEVHKHRTDPRSADSDGDGLPDGEWRERREFTYVVRLVMQVMKPVTPEFLTGDFQDARVLDETEERVELELLLYPFATAPQALRGADDWRGAAAESALARWLEPGITSDCDATLRARLLELLAADGIDVLQLDDRATVEQASKWLLRHARYADGFTTFATAFDADGRPFVPEELRAHVGELTDEALACELSARGMFERAQCGSCSSSSIYLSGCLRALGIPTRTVLCIPILDASDERQWALVRNGIEQRHVRRTVLAAMRGLERSWCSHTFNEVHIGGRWWRLDYDLLGAGILRRERFGLMAHVATFHDWSDARMPETIGRRQMLELRDAVLAGLNPYALLSVRDEVGAHCTLVLPEVEPPRATLEALSWTDDPKLDEDVRASLRRADRFGLLARLTGLAHAEDARELLAICDRGVKLEAAEHPTLSVSFDPGCWWFRGDHALVYLPIAPEQRRELAVDVEYGVRPLDARIGATDDLAVVRSR